MYFAAWSLFIAAITTLTLPVSTTRLELPMRRHGLSILCSRGASSVDPTDPDSSTHRRDNRAKVTFPRAWLRSPAFLKSTKYSRVDMQGAWYTFGTFADRVAHSGEGPKNSTCGSARLKKIRKLTMFSTFQDRAVQTGRVVPEEDLKRSLRDVPVAVHALADYSKVVLLFVRYTSVNFGVKRCLGLPR